MTRLAGKGTAAVACGHSYTAAVLTDGTLYTWGTGLGGQLGLGPNVMAAVWPTRITTGLEGVRWVTGALQHYNPHCSIFCFWTWTYGCLVLLRWLGSVLSRRQAAGHDLS